jgi:hypothetical protein
MQNQGSSGVSFCFFHIQINNTVKLLEELRFRFVSLCGKEDQLGGKKMKGNTYQASNDALKHQAQGRDQSVEK